PLRLGDLVGNLTILDGRFAADQPITGIAYDSRRVRPGELFVAVRGRRADGHHHIAEAVERGAAAVIVEVGRGSPAPAYVRVPNSRIALAQLSAAWFGHPARRLRLVGITGTAGKTSVMIILTRLLQRIGWRVDICGSVRELADGSLVHAPYTTPQSWELHRRLRQLADQGTDWVILEATSHALDQHRLFGIRFTAGVFLNLMPEHLDYHGSFDAYVRVKARFLDHLEPQAPLVYSAADERVAAIARRHPGRRLAFAVEPTPADVVARGLRVTGAGSTFTLEFGDAQRRYPCHIGLLGRHQVENATAAAACAWALGVEPPAIASALAAAKPFYRRTQPLEIHRITVIDDTVGLPRSIHHCFEAVAPLMGEPVLIVHALRGSRGPRVNRDNAAALAAGVKRLREQGRTVELWLTAAVDVVDERDRVRDGEKQAAWLALQEAGVDAHYEPELREALRRVAARAHPGALVLLLGAQGMNRGAELLRGLLAETQLAPITGVHPPLMDMEAGAPSPPAIPGTSNVGFP
ncbi:MAG TPA: Mur ligase family protein, partial [Bacillota bacterium]